MLVCILQRRISLISFSLSSLCKLFLLEWLFSGVSHYIGSFLHLCYSTAVSHSESAFVMDNLRVFFSKFYSKSNPNIVYTFIDIDHISLDSKSITGKSNYASYFLSLSPFFSLAHDFLFNING